LSDVYLRQLERKDAAALLDIRLRNREFFQPYEPIRDESDYTLEGQEKGIAESADAAEKDQAYAFGIFEEGTDELVGRIALTGIARGVAQHANVGYYLDQAHNGKGYATAAVILAVRYGFEELGLHRVQAGVMPWNPRSARVLTKSGFRREGLAERYIFINGKWEDHELFAITAEELEK